jgi:hypothetical protein
MIKKILRPIIPQFAINRLKKARNQKELTKWYSNGCPIPPPHIVKQRTIQEYQNKYQYTTFIETGTYLGDMVEAQKKIFRKIYSIELGLTLFDKATKRFKNDKNITIIQGDSGEVLKNVLLELNEPAIFWLDGHYSGGITAKGDKNCPIYKELDAISESKGFNHILLIDDARCFNGNGDYPTVDQLTEYIKSKNEKYQVHVKDDIIRCVIS